MKQTTVIITAPKRERRIFPGRPNGQAEVLFEPIAERVAALCREAGISRVALLAEEDLELPEAEKLSAGALSNWLRALPGEVFILPTELALIRPETVRRSLELYRQEKKACVWIGESPGLACWADPAQLAAGLDTGSPAELEQAAQRIEGGVSMAPVHPGELSWIDSPSALLFANETAKGFEIARLLEKGVFFLGLDGVFISRDAEIEAGTTILPGTILKKGVRIGANCVIGPNTLLEQTEVGNSSRINASQSYQSWIGNGVSIGPFCHIRPNSRILDGVHIGDFVEVKNSVVGEETHISHLTYVGDSDVGKGVNFGCGCVTVNYNGQEKNRCRIGDHAFIGCNTNLVAPVTIGDYGYTAAGSTITDDLPEGSMGIARARQVNKPGWNKGGRRLKKK